jgi:hypothetical protein
LDTNGVRETAIEISNHRVFMGLTEKHKWTAIGASTALGGMALLFALAHLLTLVAP